MVSSFDIHQNRMDHVHQKLDSVEHQQKNVCQNLDSSTSSFTKHGLILGSCLRPLPVNELQQRSATSANRSVFSEPCRTGSLSCHLLKLQENQVLLLQVSKQEPQDHFVLLFLCEVQLNFRKVEVPSNQNQSLEPQCATTSTSFFLFSKLKGQGNFINGIPGPRL